MRFTRWLEHTIILHLALIIPILILALIPLTYILTHFFQLSLQNTLLIIALLITLTLWANTPRNILPPLSREALQTLRETRVMRDEIEREALSLAQETYHPPAHLILALTIIFTISWIIALTTTTTTLTSILTSMGIIHSESQHVSHTGFDIPMRMRAAITGSEETSLVRTAPLERIIHPDILRASRIEELAISGGGLGTGRSASTDTSRTHDETRIIRISQLATHEADPSIIAYYTLISTR